MNNAPLAADISVWLDDGQGHDAQVASTLPKDFKRNSTAQLKLIMVPNETGCSYDLNAKRVIRDRVGLLEADSIDPATNGISAAAPGPTPAPNAALKSFSKTFKIAKPSGAEIKSQLAGDLIVIQIFRDTPADTCLAELWVIGGKLIYQTP